MEGWASAWMFSSVKFPSGVWNAPTMSRNVGRIRNIRAKMKNGATPSQLHGKRKRCGAQSLLFGSPGLS